MIDLALKILLFALLLGIIVQDIKEYRISIYWMLGILALNLYFQNFSLNTLLIGILIIGLLNSYLFLTKKHINHSIGSADWALILLFSASLPIQFIPYFLIISGSIGLIFGNIFKKDIIPLGATLAFGYGILTYY